MDRLGWADSSAKHGIDRADALHAMRLPAMHVPSFDESRAPGRARPDLFIGSSRDRTELIEVMVIVGAEATDAFVFHVMPLRFKTLERARGLIAERKRHANR